MTIHERSLDSHHIFHDLEHILILYFSRSLLICFSPFSLSLLSIYHHSHFLSLCTFCFSFLSFLLVSVFENLLYFPFINSLSFSPTISSISASFSTLCVFLSTLFSHGCVATLINLICSSTLLMPSFISSFVTRCSQLLF